MRRTKQGQKSRQPSNGGYDIEEFDREFLIAFTVIDSAVTGALLAGMPPSIFGPVLSYLFISTAAQVRQLDASKFLQSTEQFDQVVESITKFATSFDGFLIDRGEHAELKQLRKTVKQYDLSELEERGRANAALEIGNWVTTCLSKLGDRLLLALELAYLAEWLKVAALAGEVDDEVYLIFKQSMPLCMNVYDIT